MTVRESLRGREKNGEDGDGSVDRGRQGRVYYCGCGKDSAGEIRGLGALWEESEELVVILKCMGGYWGEIKWARFYRFAENEKSWERIERGLCVRESVGLLFGVWMFRRKCVIVAFGIIFPFICGCTHRFSV